MSMVFTREQLYEKIWSKSLKQLSQELDIPAHKLKQYCQTLNIPTPSAAYWNKLKWGYRVEKTPLPELPGEINLEDAIDAITQSEEDVRAKEIISDPNFIISPIEDINKADRLVRESFLYYNAVTKRSHTPPLHIDVSPKNRLKGHLIFNNVIHGLKLRGHTIESTPEKTYAIIKGRRIEVTLREKKQRDQTNPLETIYADKLYVRVNHRAYEYGIKDFIDGPRKPLKDRFVEIIAYMELKADFLIKEELDREANEEAANTQLQQNQPVVDDKYNFSRTYDIQELIKASERHNQSRAIHDYLAEYSLKLILDDQLDGEKTKWIQWAYEQSKTD